MNIFDKEKNNHSILWIGLQLLVIIDIFLISMLLLLHLPSDVISFIEEFDLYICVLLLIEWSISFLTFNSKTKFLKQKGNWLNLIASIPFDAFLPIFLPQLNLLRYFRLLKILRVIVLFNSLISSLKDFIQKTHIEKILFGIIVIIGIFTLIVWNWSNLNLVDSLYFVIETITSVGYGDITPKSINEKALTMVLIFIGVFVFSTITAVISSFFTDKLINDEQIEQDLQVVKKDLTNMQRQNEGLKQDLEALKNKNDDLINQINELKELVKK